MARTARFVVALTLIAVIVLLNAGCATFKEAVVSPHTYAACKGVDIATTAWVIKHGGSEANPMMAGLLSHGWIPFLFAQGLVIWVIYELADAGGKNAEAGIFIANGVGCGVAAHNIGVMGRM